MSVHDETLVLLRAAREVLQNYWFWSEDGEEGNNDDVIAISERIDAHLLLIDGTTKEGS